MTLFLACALTVMIETPFLALFGYRKRDEIAVVVCANVVTNLTMNLLLLRFPAWRGAAVYLLEAAVVAAEYGIFRLAFGRRRGLLLLTLAANVLSCALGLLLVGMLQALPYIRIFAL